MYEVRRLRYAIKPLLVDKGNIKPLQVDKGTITPLQVDKGTIILPQLLFSHLGKPEEG